MNLKAITCLSLGMSVFVAEAEAAQLLAVDINGYNAGGGQIIGPTAAGYQGFEAAEGLFLDPSIDWGNSGAAGLTRVFGAYTVNIKGVGTSLGARNRGANADALGDVTQDFVFAQRDANAGLGQNYIKISISGLDAGKTYEFTGFARDHFNGGTDSFQAWTDRAKLGGVDGPGAFLGAGVTYQPALNGALNPIPILDRSPISGPASADPSAYAAEFLTTADLTGLLEIYLWADPNSFSGVQSASLLNGFLLSDAPPSQVPEPSSLALLALSLLGIGLWRRTS